MNMFSAYDHFQEPLGFGSSESPVARLLAGLRRWAQRSRDRDRLLEMDERLLQDLGIRREDALQEAAKPFWQS